MQVIVEAVPYDPNDERHRLVTRVRENYSSEIAAHQQLLGTYYHSIALIDLARQRLDAGTFGSSEPDWSLVIRDASLGYGYRDGVVDSTTLTGAAKPKESDYTILRSAYGLSSAFLKAKGNANSIQLNQVYTKSSPVSAMVDHLKALNQIAATVPAAICSRVQDICRKIFVVDSLSVGMDINQRSFVIDAVEAISKNKHTPAFVTACKGLAAGMEGQCLSDVIRGVGKVPEDKYLLLINTSNSITLGMDLYEKSQAVRAVVKVHPNKYIPAFVTTCRGLFVGTRSKKYKVISAVGALSVDKYTPKFVETCNALSMGLDGIKKGWVINALNMLLAFKYPAFIAAYNSLSTGMDPNTKINLLGILARMLETKDAAVVVAGCSGCSAGKVGVHKLEAIKNYAKGTI